MTVTFFLYNVAIPFFFLRSQTSFLLLPFFFFPSVGSQTGQIGVFQIGSFPLSLLSLSSTPSPRIDCQLRFLFLLLTFLSLSLISAGAFSFYATWLTLVSTVGFFTLSQILVWFLAMYLSPSHIRADFEVLLSTARKPLISHLLVTGRLEEAALPRRAGSQASYGLALDAPQQDAEAGDGSDAQAFFNRTRAVSLRRSGSTGTDSQPPRRFDGESMSPNAASAVAAFVTRNRLLVLKTLRREPGPSVAARPVTEVDDAASAAAPVEPLPPLLPPLARQQLSRIHVVAAQVAPAPPGAADADRGEWPSQPQVSGVASGSHPPEAAPGPSDQTAPSTASSADARRVAPLPLRGPLSGDSSSCIDSCCCSRWLRPRVGKRQPLRHACMGPPRNRRSPPLQLRRAWLRSSLCAAPFLTMTSYSIWLRRL